MARPLLAIAATLALSLGIASSADAATTLGSVDPDGPPDAFACAACPAGPSIGFRQYALQRATVVAPEAGVLVSARAYVKRIAGTAQPAIAVLTPDDEGIGATVTATAPLPATSAAGELVEIRDLHLAVQTGDEVAVMLPPGQVDLGIRSRTRPDGGVVTFSAPCTPCSGTSAGTGAELLFSGTVEPDFDEDLLGDETQDPDGGFGEEEEFEDEEFEDEDDFGRDRRRGRRRVRLVRMKRNPDGGLTLVLATPRAGRLVATARARRRMIATGRARTRRARRVRLRLRPQPSARRRLARPVRTTVKVKFRGRQALTRTVTLRRRAT
jgi:hypothetical protein